MSFKTPLVEDNIIWDIYQSQHVLPTVTVSIEIGLFDLFDREGPLTRDQVVDKLKIGQRAAAAILAVLAGLKLLQKNGAAFAITNKGKNFLVSQSEFSWANMLVGDSLPEPHKRLLKVLKEDKNWEGGAAKEWEMGELSSARAEELTNQMHSHSFPAALGAARTFDWTKTKRFLDVAGGSGCFAIALALEQSDKIEHYTVAELPQVTPFTLQFIKKFGLEKKIDAHNLNMFKEKYPTNYDTHFYSNIFHDWSYETNVELAKKSFESLPSGGRILLHEMVMKDNEDGDLTTACFSVHMLIYTKGKQFSFLELKTLLESAGFQNISLTPTYGYYSIVMGIKP